MIIAFTGTPGTGKTTTAEATSTGRKVVSVKDLAEEVGCVEDYDAGADSYEIDVQTLKEYVGEYMHPMNGTVILDGHLSHMLGPHFALVFRTAPATLKRRLGLRNYGANKIWDNVQAEAIDLILIESIQILGSERVFELDTSEAEPGATEALARNIVEALEAGRPPAKIQTELGVGPGNTDWSEEFMNMPHLEDPAW